MTFLNHGVTTRRFSTLPLVDGATDEAWRRDAQYDYHGIQTRSRGIRDTLMCGSP